MVKKFWQFVLLYAGWRLIPKQVKRENNLTFGRMRTEAKITAGGMDFSGPAPKRSAKPAQKSSRMVGENGLV